MFFNVNQHEHAILCVRKLASVFPDADTVACRIVEGAYLHLELGIRLSITMMPLTISLPLSTSWLSLAIPKIRSLSCSLSGTLSPYGKLPTRNGAMHCFSQTKTSYLEWSTVIELKPSSYLGYQLKNTAVHGAQRFDEAITFRTVLSSFDNTLDAQARKLHEQYISPSQVECAIQKDLQLELIQKVVIVWKRKELLLHDIQDQSHLPALQLIIRLGQPFRAILLAQQRGGEYMMDCVRTVEIL
ncbi:hypothetical protein BDR07DRAFT_1459029 [Suillus spraguei]|nr:hypothetical protein BDR07DRAFT_1459029 [Suillus spraguei]